MANCPCICKCADRLATCAGTITVNGRSGSGGILFDTGVTTGFLTPPIGVTLKTGMGPGGAECNGSNPPSCAVQWNQCSGFFFKSNRSGCFVELYRGRQ